MLALHNDCWCWLHAVRWWRLHSVCHITSFLVICLLFYCCETSRSPVGYQSISHPPYTQMKPFSGLCLLVHLALPAPSYWLANFSIRQITGQTLPTYSHCVTCFGNVSYSTWPMMKAACYFAISGTIHPETQQHIPEDQSPQLRCCENLSHRVLLSYDFFHLQIDLLLQFLVFH